MDRQKLQVFMPWLLLLVFSGGLLCYYYGTIIQKPDHFLFDAAGDGLKNYYTYVYYLDRDSTILHFGGLNYPYGDHIVFTDGHPGPSLIIKALGLEAYAVPLLNLAMLGSYLLAAIFLFLIFRLLDVRRWMAVIGATAIMMMSPQVFRMNAHYALAYACAIPMCWYFLLRYHRSEYHWKWALVLFLNGLFWCSVHLYLAAMMAGFLLVYWVLKRLANRTEWRQWRHWLVLGLVILGPILLTKLSISLTDTHTGRSENPGGFFLYMGEIDDLFLPNHPPLRPVLDEWLPVKIKLKWEAWSYVGLSTTLMLLASLVSILFSRLRSPTFPWIRNYFGHKELWLALGASIPLLIFSWGFPFKDFPELLDWLALLKQFRAVGRFNWVFFYVLLVCVIYVLDRWSVRQKERNQAVLSVLLPVVICGFYFWEAHPHHMEVSLRILGTKNYFDLEQLPEDYSHPLEKIAADKYQAILPLPFYNIGAETFIRPQSYESVRASMFLSYHAALPIMANFMSRTSADESKRLTQVMSPPYCPKLIKADLPNQKPFLIVKSYEAVTPLEQAIIDRAQPIFESERVNLYEISYNDLFIEEPFPVIPKDSIIFYADYESLESEVAFKGNGAFNGAKEEVNILGSIPAGPFEPGRTYHMSLWLYNDFPDPFNQDFYISVIEGHPPTGGRWDYRFMPNESEIIYGDWSKVQIDFEVRSAEHMIEIASFGKLGDKGKMRVDELILWVE